MPSACATCALRSKPVFTDFTPHELAFMEDFRVGETHLRAGEVLYHEGDALDLFYTAKTGQGARYKYLTNGDRQLVNFVFPGDTIGLQGVLANEAAYTVAAASDMVFCTFRRTRLNEIFAQSPDRGYALVWITAAEEHFLSEIIATLGQRKAQQRMAWALLKIHRRLSDLGLALGDAVPFPFRQRDLADALGLSLVHTNKTLACLRPHAQWQDGILRVTNTRALSDLAMLNQDQPPPRPLL
ncbi:MAG: Crp/Fnr family transcriptional regulator [Rhodobacteraceae bacterium]|nr:MAG: Crp/Fnr family transcriptional regulator [Paracoccaceae bacterium]